MFAGGYCGDAGPVGWLLMIAFWASLIALVLWAVTRLFPGPPRYTPDRYRGGEGRR